MTEEGTVLVVEDNDDDVYFMRRALQTAGVAAARVSFVGDGPSALEFLRRAATTAPGNPALPQVVFLDLKLPLLHGLEVLAEIRRDPALQALPIIILTSSSEERDRRRAEELGIQGYLVKPPTAAMLQAVFAAL